jgi:hypothetical protein
MAPIEGEAHVHCGRLRSLQMSSNLYNTLMRSNSFDGLMRAAAAIVALTAAMSLRIAAAENLQDEHARVADWRAKRLASLTSETGWLTPIALYWLKDGENSFGRASDRAFSVDDAALAADTGAFVLTDGRVRYIAHASKAMTPISANRSRASTWYPTSMRNPRSSSQGHCISC